MKTNIAVIIILFPLILLSQNKNFQYEIYFENTSSDKDCLVMYIRLAQQLMAYSK